MSNKSDAGNNSHNNRYNNVINFASKLYLAIQKIFKNPY